MPEPAVHGVAGEVAGDEKIDCRAAIGPDGDGDHAFPKSEDAAGGEGGRGERDDDHLQEHERARVGEHAEPAEVLEFVVRGEEEIGQAVHGFWERWFSQNACRLQPRAPLDARPRRLYTARVLSSLKVRHFRCFEAFEAEFAPGANFIVGPNARGKTSVLEAACILLRLQSPRVTRLAHVIQHERRGLVVDGYFGARHLQFYLSRERKKLALDGVEQKTAREYLEIARLVYFGNRDIEIVRGSGEGRRRFLDFVAAQLDGGYRKTLRDYERALRSRNLLLK